MRFHRIRITYTIDLELPEKERWHEVIKAEKVPARRLMKEALESVDSIPRILRTLIKQMYRVVGGRYLNEIEAWSEALRIPTENLLLMQCSYELSHLTESSGVVGSAIKKGGRIMEHLEGIKGRLMGCTSGIKNTRTHGMVHLRSLEWPLNSGGEATRIFRFVKGEREFVSVGMVGMVGVLSGMLPGAYSVTINWAAPDTDPDIRALGPLFLLREVLETCDTYEEAVYALKHSPVSTHVFFTICGTKTGDACTIERGKRKASVRKHRAGTHAQGNLYVNRPFSHLNAKAHNLPDEDEDKYISIFDDSTMRVETMEREFESFRPGKSLSSFSAVLKKSPVRSDSTIHQIAFHPRSGDLCVWARSE